MKLLNKNQYRIGRNLSLHRVRTAALVFILITSYGCKKESESGDFDYIQEFELRVLEDGMKTLIPINTSSALRIKSNLGSYPKWSLFQNRKTLHARDDSDYSLFIYMGDKTIYSGRREYTITYPYSANKIEWKLFNPDGKMTLYSTNYDSSYNSILYRIDIQFDNADSSTYYSGLYRPITDF